MNLELHRHNKTTFQLFDDKFLCQSFSAHVGLNSAKNISIEHFPDATSAFFGQKSKKNQNIKCHFGDCLGEVSPKVSPASFQSVTKPSQNFTHK